MDKEENILILNIGGTFNKVYNPLTGELDVPQNNDAIEDILDKSLIKNIEISGLIYKDSLDMDNCDRYVISEYIKNSKYKKIIIVHGTDTIDKTAEFLSQNIKNKKIVLTAAMQPYSIDKVETVSNFMMCYGFLLACNENKIYIGMHGIVNEYQKIRKNRTLGVFECLK